MKSIIITILLKRNTDFLELVCPKLVITVAPFKLDQDFDTITLFFVSLLIKKRNSV